MAHDEDDLELLHRWREGDRDAGDALIRRHYRYALGIARKRLGPGDAAVEATQQAMEILVQKREEIEKSFRGYLARVVSLCALRQATGRRYEPYEGDEPDPAPPPGAATFIEGREEAKLLVVALRSLSTSDQLLLYYDYRDDRSRSELAELLEIPITSIYGRLSKAGKRLRKRLEGFRESPERQKTIGGLETWLKSMERKAPEREGNEDEGG
jgi:RNA polymerase sigma factor (sigma-70 family)